MNYFSFRGPNKFNEGSSPPPSIRKQKLLGAGQEMLLLAYLQATPKLDEK